MPNGKKTSTQINTQDTSEANGNIHVISKASSTIYWESLKRNSKW